MNLSKETAPAFIARKLKIQSSCDFRDFDSVWSHIKPNTADIKLSGFILGKDDMGSAHIVPLVMLAAGSSRTRTRTRTRYFNTRNTD
jgi:hypothetical protein